VRYLSVLVALVLLPLPAPASAVGTPTSSTCATSAYVPSPVGGLKGTTTGGDFYAQLTQTVPSNVNEKIVLRISGAGSLTLAAIGPQGQSVTPTVLDFHTGGSTWSSVVPGDEWGSLWVFPAPGCWDLHAVRSDVVGDIHFQAVAPVFTDMSFHVSSPHGSIRSGQKITFSISPDIVPGPVTDGLSGSITIRHAGKVYRVLKLKPTGVQLYQLATRLRVQKPTSFTARARVTFLGTTVSRTVQFLVLPEPKDRR
jgi:hypothetical protein